MKMERDPGHYDFVKTHESDSDTEWAEMVQCIYHFVEYEHLAV